MRRMADDTTLTQCLVLIHKRAALLRVTLEAGFVSAQEREAAGLKRLLNICRRAFNRDSSVRLVAIGAAHFAFRHWMMVRQLECRANFQMTLETGLRRFSRIDNRVRRAAAFNVQTPRPMACFAAHVHGLLGSFAALCAGLTYDFPCCLQSRMGGCSEVANDLFVAGGAFLRADKLRARNAWRSENCSIGRTAGKQNHRECYGSPGTPQQTLALTVDPSS